ncbi:uncharacterized protein [Spinacia oleracea]|uniref:Transposase, Ptta/En/Spm, plant n=1 Tax=Spinacia oleracea TaxID=3562 RepID=A0ABM3QYZ2_SPIOL|nr:uncharacterized protein LOC130463487 [Spinacia oleracea]
MVINLQQLPRFRCLPAYLPVFQFTCYIDMTYRKRVRPAEIDGTRGPATAHTSSLSGDASLPTKKHVTQPQSSQVPTTVVKFGPFSPQGTVKSVVAPPCSSTSKSALQTDDILGAIWKKPPTGSTSSSLMEATRDSVQPKISSKTSPEVPTSIPPSNTTKSQKYPTSKSQKYHATSSGRVPPNISPASHISPYMPPNMTPIIPPSHIKTSSRVSQTNQQQNNSEEPKENSTKSKSLRVKSYPDWPVTIDFDDKEEVLTIDAKGNVKLVSGSIQTIDLWSNNGVQYYVEFNDLYQPLRKGGQMLVRFIGSIVKVETYCPLGEGDWSDIDKDSKAKMVEEIRERFVIPAHPEYNKQILKRANKSWRQYKHSLKVRYYKPDEKTLAEMCDIVPRHGITSTQWRKLVKYWASDEGQRASECGKAARASQNQFHRSGSDSYANQQADYEDEHGKKMSLLALWVKSHRGKDGTFLPGTVTEDFVDDAKAKMETLRTVDPSKSEQELENAAFEDTMHGIKGMGKFERGPW